MADPEGSLTGVSKFAMKTEQESAKRNAEVKVDRTEQGTHTFYRIIRMSLISGVAKGGPGGAQALPNLNACCALPPKLQNRDTLIEQSNILLKQSAGQVVPCQLTQSGYATEFNLLVHKSSTDVTRP